MSNAYHGRYLTPAGGWDTGPAEEPPASIPARPYDDETNSQPGRNLEQLGVAPGPLDFVRLGEQLDDADFTAAHDSVRAEIADAIHAAEEDLDLDAIVEMVQKPGRVIRMDRDLTDEEFAELRRRFEDAAKSAVVRVVEPPYTECGTTDPCGLHCLDRAAADLHQAVVIAEATAAPVIKRRSIVGRIWRRLRAWRR